MLPFPNIYFRSGIYIYIYTYFFVPYRNQNYWNDLAQIWYGRSLGLKLLNKGIPGQRRVPEVTICYLWDTLVFEQFLTEISRNLSTARLGRQK